MSDKISIRKTCITEFQKSKRGRKKQNAKK